MANTSTNSNPIISVGLPLYNGEKYMRQSIDSILNQTLPDFELVISDNGSTDATQAICEEYASKDSRIRYICYEQNRGGPWNSNNTFKLSRGKYFKWAAYDDLIRPRFLEACIVALEERPDYVCCWPNNDVIKEDGSLFQNYVEPSMELESDRPHLRFRDAVFGVAKAGKLTPGMRIPVHGPDKIAETKPDYVFILPWNLKEEISEQMNHIRERGGKFVVSIPKLTIFLNGFALFDPHPLVDRSFELIEITCIQRKKKD